jgi:putative ABC transport system permease protein
MSADRKSAIDQEHTPAVFRRIGNAVTQLTEGIGIALGSLQANKGRASLTILGVSIGVAVVMVIASMITGINRGVTDIVEQLGPRTFFVFRFFQGGVVISDGSDDPRRRNPPLSLQEGAAIEALPSIDLVVAAQETGRQVEFAS